MKKELPSGWQELKLNELFNNLNERNHEDKTILASTQNRGVIPNYMLGKDIIRKEDSLSNYKLVKKDCFIISLRSFQGGFEHSNYEGIVSPAYTILEPKINFEPLFYKAYFKSHYFINKSLAKYVEGIRDGKQIRYEECKNIVVPFPPIEEQKRIAEILSTFDDLIENLNKLIEKKELYKKGVMQRVLSGEVRFNGFKDEWETVKLKDILIAGSKDRVPDTSKYKKITIKLHNKGIEFSNIERKMADKRPFYIRKKDEIIIGKQNYFNGSIAIVDEEFDNTICSNAIMSFTVNEDCNNKFIYFLLSRKSYMQKYYHLANGTGQKELSESDFLNFNLLIPSLEEQNKIAELLTLIDQDIDNLKRLLHLRKLQKKGVMQKLLTGEVRV